MSTKKTAAKKVIRQKSIAKKNGSLPKSGTWAAVVKGAEYARKAGLQNWPG